MWRERPLRARPCSRQIPGHGPPFVKVAQNHVAVLPALGAVEDGSPEGAVAITQQHPELRDDANETADAVDHQAVEAGAVERPAASFAALASLPALVDPASALQLLHHRHKRLVLQVELEDGTPVGRLS